MPLAILKNQLDTYGNTIQYFLEHNFRSKSPLKIESSHLCRDIDLHGDCAVGQQFK